MKIREYLFHAYYHQFLTIEADELTDKLKNRIAIHEDDCYAICTAYCAEDGAVHFAVLSVGPSWDYCTRGLEKDEIYGIFTMEEVAECEARLLDYELESFLKYASIFQLHDRRSPAPGRVADSEAHVPPCARRADGCRRRRLLDVSGPLPVSHPRRSADQPRCQSRTDLTIG